MNAASDEPTLLPPAHLSFFLRCVENNQLHAPPLPGGDGQLWWIPGEAGWGLSLSSGDGNWCGTLFTVDNERRDAWFAAPRLIVREDGVLVGPLSRNGQQEAAGSLILRFNGRDDAIADITIDGITWRKQLRRQSFAPTDLTGDYFVTIAAASVPDDPRRPAMTSLLPRQELWKFLRTGKESFRFSRLGHRDVHPAVDETATVARLGQITAVDILSSSFPSGRGGHIFIALDSITASGITGSIEVRDDPVHPGCRLLGNLSGVRLLEKQLRV